MQKFFSAIFKQKYFLIFAVLFFSGLFVLTPSVAHAAWYDWLIPNGVIGTTIITGVAYLIWWISYGLLALGSSLFTLVFESGILQQAVNANPAVISGWTTVRDFSNMFIVLGFIVIGISFILRIEGYGTYKTLLKLIGVALLINFSLLFCGMMIDGANITMNWFLKAPGQNVNGGVVIKPITDAINNIPVAQTVQTYIAASKWTDLFSFIISMGIYAALAAIIFIMYAVLFLMRQVALMCLVILAPLACVCFVFPATKKIFQQWWEQFFQWCIVGISATFFMYLAGQVAAQQGLGVANAQAIGIGFLLPVAFLYFAYTLTFKISAIGAAGAVGLATGAVGYAWGGTKAAGGWAGGKTMEWSGAKRAGQAVGDFATKWTPSWIVGKGALAKRQAARLEEGREDTKYWSEKQKIASATGGAYTAKQKQAKLANIEWAAEKGKFDNDAQVASAAKFYASNQALGSDKMKDLADKDWRFARYDKKQVDKYMDVRGIDKSIAANRTAAEISVAKEKLDSKWSSMNSGQRAHVDKSYLDDNAFLEKNMNFDSARAFTMLPAGHENRDLLRGKVGPIGSPPTAGSGYALDEAIVAAHDAGNTAKERRLLEARDIMQTLT